MSTTEAAELVITQGRPLVRAIQAAGPFELAIAGLLLAA